MTSPLFEPITLRGVTLRNRIVIAPMCMYSATDGVASDYHLVHLGRFALGGAGLVMVEATAVQARGRITHGDLGLWHDGQVAPLARIAAFLAAQGAVPAIQLAHAGRKASMQRPWHGNGPLGTADRDRGDEPWGVIAPSAEPVDAGWLMPQAMTLDDIATLKADFVAAAQRARRAGFEVIELHCAHGYLMHSFLSPLSNHRDDAYGGSRENRMRLPLEVARALRAAWPEDRPVFVRVSAVDGNDVGWSLDDTVAFARELRTIGIDVVDCSSGGIAQPATSGLIPRGYGFQVPFARAVRELAGVASMAVGLIVDPQQAEAIVAAGEADLVAIARQALDDPNWPLHAATALAAGQPGVARYQGWPPQAGWWLGRRAAVMDKLGPVPLVHRDGE